MFNCKYCEKECKNENSLRNHERMCKQNPNRQESAFIAYNKKKITGEITVWNKGLTKETDERLAKAGIKISQSNTGKPGRKHTEEEKAYLREVALKNKFGGFNMRKKGIMYNNTKLDSSYEVLLAQNLDANNIKWERCKRFPYVINGKLHYYTPDFYLPEYNIYLDPKNDYLINNINPILGYSDIEKIEVVSAQNNIKIIILNKEQLTWDYIKSIV